MGIWLSLVSRMVDSSDIGGLLLLSTSSILMWCGIGLMFVCYCMRLVGVSWCMGFRLVEWFVGVAVEDRSCWIMIGFFGVDAFGVVWLFGVSVMLLDVVVILSSFVFVIRFILIFNVFGLR